MPHLSFEYSANLEPAADLPGLCAALRDAMVGTGLFPLGGIRIRGFRADHWLIADGAGADDAFLHMTASIGAGRSAQDRAAAREAIYAAAETWLRPRLAGRPFALSLDLQEIAPGAGEKRWNTVHDRLGTRSSASN
ncbi:MAG: 5-carboxymethyl-2-hydroxymuconate isomerase [Pseudomonadota bacterium]